MQFIRSTTVCFTIWVLTALLNALADGTWLSLISGEFENWLVAFIIVFVFTLIFSIPGILVFWIILLVSLRRKRLFRLLLQSSLFISSLSSLLLCFLTEYMLDSNGLFLAVFIVIAPVTSLMIHYKLIQSISLQSNPE